MQGDPAFGQWVRRLRGVQDLTQEALAERLGCATDTIRKIEGGARRPSRETAARLAEILAVPTAQHEAFLRLARTLARFEPPGAVAQVVAGPAVATAADGPAPVAPFPTGTVTFLFSDIEGSTQLWERDPQAMALALARHDELIRQTIEAHGGLVFCTVGDAFCTAFASARAALYREAWGLSSPLRVRMALHTGSVDWHEAAMEARTLSIALDALAGLATLLEETGDGAQALELSAIILAHPASGQAASLRAAQLRASAVARVGHEVVLLIEERARGRSLELVASALTTPAECA